MGNYRVITGQNIYDVALHLYGSIEGIVDLLINNPGLSLETELRTGQELTYTDGFIINADVVAYNEMHGIVPSNGERHVYPKHFTCPQTAVFSLSAALVSVQCEVSGTGTLEIDWGDDSAAETVILGHIPYTLHHTFDSRVRHKRKIRWFADASFRHIDWSGMTPSSVILLRELHVEELTLRGCTLALDGFRILSGTYRIDLSGSMVSDLLPLIECRGLMELDLAEGNQLPVFLAVPFFQLADTCRAYKLVHLVTAYRKCFHTDTVSTFHQQKRPVTVHLQADVHTTVLRTFSRGDYLTVLGLDGLGK